MREPSPPNPLSVSEERPSLDGLSEGGPKNPMRAAQANMRPKPVRRFFEAVELGEANGRHALMLDGRRARTPGRAQALTGSTAPGAGLRSGFALGS